MKEYELTVLLHPDLEIDLEKPLGKIKKLIKDSGGTISKEDNWGKRRLAYSIKKESFAVYVYFELQLPPEGVKKVNDTLNITDEVLRFLLVKADLKARLAAEEREKEEAAAEKEASSSSKEEEGEKDV
ncbi:MAG TPA: 30S ribosomal protein S6 [Candidatus Saccharimonadales bacterium]|nr:30S ribosomal protein S6 [Candidatus Saccharimonadales bacterium]